MGHCDSSTQLGRDAGVFGVTGGPVETHARQREDAAIAPKHPRESAKLSASGGCSRSCDSIRFSFRLFWAEPASSILRARTMRRKRSNCTGRGADIVRAEKVGPLPPVHQGWI